MIEFRIQEKTRSLNESFRGDWRPRAAVAKRQRAKAMGACPKWPGGPLLCVRLTRVSPGTLDRDNLHGALKGIRDGLAARLRIDDASPLVSWEYHQTKGQAEVVVQIWRWNTDEEAPPLPFGRPVERSGRNVLAVVTADAGKNMRVVRDPGEGLKRAPREFEGSLRKPSTVKGGRKPSANYIPPRSAPDAASEAEETFAPPADRPVNHPQWCACARCRLGGAV